MAFKYLNAEFSFAFNQLGRRAGDKMSKTKKGDFIELHYTGMIKDTGAVFDTTEKEIALKAGIHSDKATYSPIVVCIGKGHVIKGLDSRLEGAEIGKDVEIHVPAEEAFGRRNPELIQLIPTSKFKKEGIEPVPGLEINVDGMLGVVKSVSGGRTLVDFNPPLAGHDVVYRVRVIRKIEDSKEKLLSALRAETGRDADVRIEGSKAFIDLGMELNQSLKEVLESRLKEMVREINEFEFASKNAEREAGKKAEEGKDSPKANKQQ